MRLLPRIISEIKFVLLIELLYVFPFSTAYTQISSANKNFVGTVKGIVVDSASQAALSNVSVEAHEPGKIQSFRSTITDERGYFELTKLRNKQYRLIITYTVYKATTIQLPYFRSHPIDLGIISLTSQAKQLKEVKVITQKPILEQNADKITYNVDEDPESKIAMALDILRKIPMLSIDAEDNVQLNGNNNYRVLINGKSSSLFLLNQSDLFKNMPASAIKTIEVITVPPSRYAAEGVGGIINITTYKKSIRGYNGGINLRSSNPGGYSANANVTASLEKISLAGNIGYNSNTSPTTNSFFSREDKLRQNRLEQVGNSNNKNWWQNSSGEISYEIDSMDLITAGYSLNNGNSNNNFIQHVTLLNTIDEKVEAYKNLSSGKSKSHGNDLSIDYQRSFKKNDEQQLSLSYKYSNSTNTSNTDFMLQPLVNFKDKLSITANDDRSLEQNLQADYVQPIKKHALEIGVSATLRSNNSDYFYENQDTVTRAFIIDTGQSNNFNYTEDIYAGYTSLNLRMGKWGLRIGGRLEQAKVYAHFISSGTNAVRKYLNLIPNLTLSRQLKGISMISLSYTQRIERPNLYFLNPYVDLTDPWNISYGNPNLRPALAHVFNLAYNIFIKKTSFNINVFHQFSNNSIQQFTTLNADTISRTTFGNIGKNENSSVLLGSNTTLFKKLSINLNGTANYVKYTSVIDGKPRTNEGLTYNISGSVNLRLKSWRAGSNISYNAPNIFLQGRSAGYVANSITINKYFLKNNKVNIGFSVSSPFRQYRYSFMQINDPTFYQLRKSSILIRRFNLSLNYRFMKL